MNTYSGAEIENTVRAFDIRGDFVSALPHGSGHINDSLAVTLDVAGRKVRTFLQRINHTVFTDVPRLMDNIARVTEHQRRKLTESGSERPSRGALTIIPARDGKPYFLDGEGRYWRLYLFIEGARTFDVVERPEQAAEAARAFGHFQAQLTDLPGGRLAETIPDFHHTPARFAQFERALAADSSNRAAGARAEIAAALRLRPLASRLVDLHARELMPERIVHNDTKLNNVMLDDATGKAVCVVDLDTVMPGLALYDFGDMVRSGVNSGREDEPDLSKIHVRMDIFAALAAGYLSAARVFLTPTEIDRMAFAGRLISWEIGLRFLTDFLNGDVYFKVHRPGQNLDRCRVQFRLARLMEEHAEHMEAVVASCR